MPSSSMIAQSTTPCSSTDQIRQSCAAALAIDESAITVVATPVAGAKTGRAEVFAALVSWLTQQSAKVKF